MEDIRKERLMITIISIACLGNITESIIAGWEFWMPPVLAVGMILIWWLHLTQTPEERFRIGIYFVCASLQAFYHGIHPISLFDAAVVILILMATFTITDRLFYLNLILLEYAAIMSIQFFLIYRDPKVFVDTIMIVRLVLHIGITLLMYFFCRLTVSFRLSANEKLDRWREAVNANSHDMEDFLSNISHELRTPVNVINGMTTLLQENSDREELNTIREAGIRLSHQIEDIQDYTELKRGELLLEEENYMCISLINDVVSTYNAVNRKKELELIVDLDPGTPTMFTGDVKKLHKIFRHLLNNALKFTKTGGIYIRVFADRQEYGANLIIEVTDTGIGMTRAGMAQVSKGMYQANKQRNRSTGGIGIGLPIVYGFVHKMGGFVRINSIKGTGTTVHISVPQQVADPSPCLAVSDDLEGDVLFYLKPDKHPDPQVREFYKELAVNLATGLGVPLYSAGDQKELLRLAEELRVSYLFLGQEEYEGEREVLDRLSGSGIRVVVSADRSFTASPGIIVMPRPMYGLPIVRILNNGAEIPGYEEERKKALRFTGVSALIVDDEPANLIVASGLLKGYKMYADTAESGKEAIEKFEKNDYDVIFMDHMMPEMDGVEAMKRIRQAALESKRTPLIVALTANALSGAREMFIREGFDGFIAKPIDIAEFERVMKKILPESAISYEGRA
ncbi:MAG: response regulator [Lachnospiraceae bacterium]|nr:response regulator [Lachnospiraceae bacterium]